MSLNELLELLAVDLLDLRREVCEPLDHGFVLALDAFKDVSAGCGIDQQRTSTGKRGEDVGGAHDSLAHVFGLAKLFAHESEHLLGVLEIAHADAARRSCALLGLGSGAHTSHKVLLDEQLADGRDTVVLGELVRAHQNAVEVNALSV